jgi:hypothetical protein
MSRVTVAVTLGWTFAAGPSPKLAASLGDLPMQLMPGPPPAVAVRRGIR